MPTLLIMDDRADVRRAIEAVLRSRGYACRPASGGEEGLAVLREEDVDAAIVDIFMPDLDGIATIQAMHREFPAVPIIAMSGHRIAADCECRPDFLKMALKFGADAALRKPFTPAQLIGAVEDVLQAREGALLPTILAAETYVGRGDVVRMSEKAAS